MAGQVVDDRKVEEMSKLSMPDDVLLPTRGAMQLAQPATHGLGAWPAVIVGAAANRSGADLPALANADAAAAAAAADMPALASAAIGVTWLMAGATLATTAAAARLPPEVEKPGSDPGVSNPASAAERWGNLAGRAGYRVLRLVPYPDGLLPVPWKSGGRGRSCGWRGLRPARHGRRGLRPTRGRGCSA